MATTMARRQARYAFPRRQPGALDFRKNASRVARATQSCPEGIVEVLDHTASESLFARDALQALEGVAIGGGRSDA